jgi:ATP-binding cassette subfamily B protein
MRHIFKIIRYAWKLWPLYLGIAGFTIIGAALSQVEPFTLKFIVDGIVRNVSGHHVAGSYIVLLIGIIIAARITASITSNIQGYFGDLLGARLTTLLSNRYYEHVLKLPLEYYDNQISGRITSRLERSIVTVTNMLQMVTNNFLASFVSSIFTLIILAYYAPLVAGLMILLFPIFYWLTALSSKVWQKQQEGINKDIDYANGRVIESINQVRVVKSFVQEPHEFKIFSGKRSDIEKATKAQSRKWHWYDIARQLSLNVIFGLIYLYVIWETFRGHFSLGTMTLIITMSAQAQFPLYGASFLVGQIQRATSGSKDFFEVIETEPSIQDKPDATSLKLTKGLIEYRHVNFSYTEGKNVLNDLSFTIQPDTKIALVGESGEGKTTISNLLLRFYDTTSGEILIDGQNIDTITQASLRQAIGVVFQEPALFSGTITNNITYGTKGTKQADVIKAAKAANAYEFIQKLPHGFESEIGERGVKLSGGQKQRIAIARAILKDAPILILDEATSSLDSKAEHEVQAALEHLMSGRTTLIIAHRLSTISNVDMIIGIKNGQIAEIGSPAELAKQEGIYAELLSLQSPGRGHTAQLRKYDLANK